MKFFKKSYTYAACFGLLLTSSFSYSMLKTFVLSDAIQTVKATTTDTKAAKKRQLHRLQRRILAIQMTISR